MALTKLQSQSVDTNITVAGVVTATAFYGDGSNLTGIGSASSATYASSAGIATYATTAGVSTYSSSSGIATYSTSSGVSTDVIGGIASVTQLIVSGVSTLANVQISSGIVTATSGVVTYYGDGSNLTGITTTRIANGTSNINIENNSTISATVGGQNVFNVTGAGVSMISGERFDVSSYSENVQFLGSVSGTTCSSSRSKNCTINVPLYSANFSGSSPDVAALCTISQ